MGFEIGGFPLVPCQPEIHSKAVPKRKPKKPTNNDTVMDHTAIIVLLYYGVVITNCA